MKNLPELGSGLGIIICSACRRRLWQVVRSFLLYILVLVLQSKLSRPWCVVAGCDRLHEASICSACRRRLWQVVRSFYMFCMSSQVVTGCTKFLTVHSSTRTTNKNWADLDVINKLQSKFVRDNHCRNVLAFFTQVENEFGSVSWSTFDAYYETITRHKAFCRQFGFGLCEGNFRMSSQVLQALQDRSHRCFRSSDIANWF